MRSIRCSPPPRAWKITHAGGSRARGPSRKPCGRGFGTTLTPTDSLRAASVWSPFASGLPTRSATRPAGTNSEHPLPRRCLGEGTRHVLDDLEPQSLDGLRFLVELLPHTAPRGEGANGIPRGRGAHHPQRLDALCRGCRGEAEEAAERGGHDAGSAGGHEIFLQKVMQAAAPVNPFLRQSTPLPFQERRRGHPPKTQRASGMARRYRYGYEGRALASKPRPLLKTSCLLLCQ